MAKVSKFDPGGKDVEKEIKEGELLI